MFPSFKVIDRVMEAKPDLRQMLEYVVKIEITFDGITKPATGFFISPKHLHPVDHVLNKRMLISEFY